MKRFPLFVCLLLVIVTAGALADAATTTATTITPSYMVTLGTPVLTSVVPWTGETNTTVTITVAGSDFGGAAGFRLRRSSENDIIGSVTSVNSTHLVGTVNLLNRVPGEYQVCVYNSPTISACGLAFTVTPPGEAATASSVFFETNPPGATVLLNGTRIGTSVFTYHNATPGTYKVLIQKSGYMDYTGSVTVLEGERVKFYAQLTPLGAGTAAATATPVTSATTIRKSTFKIPTTWPIATPTEASPVDPAIVIGAAGIAAGLVVIRRR
jgi:PEGA domain/IPT/TIG domain